ncbi:MAG: hypothetical protein L6R40_007328 [Gallowayella cf. fulva]|nr:MAG: hypothetical protein L6R40_007328 [Xanthomendoza cf. fulva]
MAPSASFSSFVTIESNAHVADPPAAVKKEGHIQHAAPDIHELDELTFGNRYHGPPEPPTPDGIHTPITPNVLEMSRPPSPRNPEPVEVMQTLNNPPMNRWRLLSACMMCFGNGLNDSAPGALIPYMEKDYSIGYAIVSFIFITNAIGFISAAPSTQPLLARLGRAKTLLLAESIMMAGHIMLVCTPPFPVVVLSFFFTGLGQAINLALNNTFCANLANHSIPLGFFHGSYGIGGTIGPLMATALVSRGRQWSSFYFISIGITLLNLGMAYWAYRHHERDNPSQTNNNLLRTPSGAHGITTSRFSQLKQAAQNKTTVLGSLFIFAYQGAEVSISGWVISFLISYRHGDPARVGYVTAGFWAGITIGRFALTHPAHKVGEKAAVIGLIVGATLFQFLVWFVPNVVGEGVAVSIVGLLLGPVYPCSTAVFSRLLGRDIQMSSLAIVSALGSSGGAVAPFFTGLLAQQAGTWVLHPICVGLFGGMVVLWGCLPRMGKRRE